MVKSDVLRHIHRLEMTTSHDDDFTIASLLVEQFNCGHFRHVVVPCVSASTPCNDVSSATSSRPFVFGKSSALAELHNSRGSMDSSSMTASSPEAASVPMSLPLSAPENFNLNVLEFMAISDALPGGVDKEVLIYKAFNMNEGFMNTICQQHVVRRWRSSSRCGRPSMATHRGKWTSPTTTPGKRPSDGLASCEDEVAGEAFRSPTIQGGDKDKLYPFLWRDMRLGDHQRFLKKQVCDSTIWACTTSCTAALRRKRHCTSRPLWSIRRGSDRFGYGRGCFRLPRPCWDQLLATQDLGSLHDGDGDRLIQVWGFDRRIHRAVEGQRVHLRTA